MQLVLPFNMLWLMVRLTPTLKSNIYFITGSLQLMDGIVPRPYAFIAKNYIELALVKQNLKQFWKDTRKLFNVNC